MNHKKRQYKAALIGYGRMGRNHDRVLREHGGFDMVAVVDETADLSEIPATSNIFKSIGEMRAAKLAVDVIFIATPTKTHLAVADSLKDLKVPLFIEKPSAHTFQDSQKILAIAKEAGIEIFIGHTERSNPVVSKLKEVIDSGVIGMPIHYSATRVGGFPNEREGTNVLLDLAVHDLDVISKFMGPLKLRSSICHHSYDARFPDTAQLLLTNEQGASAAIHVNWITPTKIRTLRVTGTHGVARVDYILQTCRVAGGNIITKSHRSEFTFTDVVNDYKNVDQIEFGVNKVEPLLNQANQVYEYLSVGTADLCRIEQASQIVNLAEMAITMGQGGIQGAGSR